MLQRISLSLVHTIPARRELAEGEASSGSNNGPSPEHGTKEHSHHLAHLGGGCPGREGDRHRCRLPHSPGRQLARKLAGSCCPQTSAGGPALGQVHSLQGHARDLHHSTAGPVMVVQADYGHVPSTA